MAELRVRVPRLGRDRVSNARANREADGPYAGRPVKRHGRPRSAHHLARVNTTAAANSGLRLFDSLAPRSRSGVILVVREVPVVDQAPGLGPGAGGGAGGAQVVGKLQHGFGDLRVHHELVGAGAAVELDGGVGQRLEDAEAVR
jgi:hypothetical protein